MPEPQCEVAETPNGIQYCDYLQGEGPAPAKGDVVRCHYTLRLASGRPVDSLVDGEVDVTQCNRKEK